MLCSSGFELYSRCVPLTQLLVCGQSYIHSPKVI